MSIKLILCQQEANDVTFNLCLDTNHLIEPIESFLERIISTSLLEEIISEKEKLLWNVNFVHQKHIRNSLGT